MGSNVLGVSRFIKSSFSNSSESSFLRFFVSPPRMRFDQFEGSIKRRSKFEGKELKVKQDGGGVEI